MLKKLSHKVKAKTENSKLQQKLSDKFKVINIKYLINYDIENNIIDKIIK